eukprot:2168713-Prymnesium_polylepis.2
MSCRSVAWFARIPRVRAAPLRAPSFSLLISETSGSTAPAFTITTEISLAFAARLPSAAAAIVCKRTLLVNRSASWRGAPAAVNALELAGWQARLQTAAAASAATGSSAAAASGTSAAIAEAFQTSVDASCMSVPAASTLMRRLTLNCAARIRVGMHPNAARREAVGWAAASASA